MATNILRPVGIWSDPPPHDAPEGALAEATNCVMRRPGVLESRYGIAATSNAPGASTNRNRKFYCYGGKIYSSTLDGSTWGLYSSTGGGAWTSLTGVGVLSPPDSTRYNVSFAEARKNLYFTTSTGVMVLVGAADTSPDFAGRPMGQAGKVTNSSNLPIWFEANDVAVYRVTLGRKDANGLVTEGPPSSRFYFTHTADCSPELKIPLPWNGVLAGDILRVYRQTAKSTIRVNPTGPSSFDRRSSQDPRAVFDPGSIGSSASTSTSLSRTRLDERPPPTGDPNDELRLVREYSLTTTDLNNGYAVVNDYVDDASQPSTLLYTNAGVEGLGQAKFRPPLARALARYAGMTWFGNLTYPYRVTVELLKVSGPNWANGNDGIGYSASKTGDVTDGTAVVTNLPVDANRAVGQIVVSPRFSAGTKILSLDSGTQVTVDTNATAGSPDTGVAFNYHDVLNTQVGSFYAAAAESTSLGSFPAVANDAGQAILSLTYLINLHYASNSLTAYSSMSKRDAARASLSLEEDGIGGSAPTAITATHASAWWSDSGSLAGTGAAFDNFVKLHGLSWSRVDEPESVPLRHQALPGDASARVLALAPTGTGLLVFKEDGVWLVRATRHDDVSIIQASTGVSLLHPDAVATSNGVAYAWTDDGILALTESNAKPISVVIHESLRSIQSALALYPASAFGAWAAGHESEGMVVFGVPNAATDVACDTMWVWNRPEAWTQWAGNYRCAVWNPADDLLYFGAESANTVSKQRRGYGADWDRYDDSAAKTINSIDAAANTITFSAPVTATAGDAIDNGAGLPIAIITADVASPTVSVDSVVGLITGSARLLTAIECTVRFADQANGNPGEQKLTTEGVFDFEDLTGVARLAINTTSDHTETYATETRSRTRDLLAQPDPVRFGFPRGAARGTRLRVKLVIRQATSAWALTRLLLEYENEGHQVRRG
jgi:hypothetical protein